MTFSLKKLVCMAGTAAAMIASGGHALAAKILIRPTPAHVETLAGHLANQLASRTNGGSALFTGPKYQYNAMHGLPTLAATFFLRDVTNILATSAGTIGEGGWTGDSGFFGHLSPISPRHCIGAQHVLVYYPSNSIGMPFIWIVPGGYYTNRILSWTNSGDLAVCLMEKTNPAVYRVLPSLTGKVKFDGIATPPVCVRWHMNIFNTNYTTAFVSGLKGAGSFGAYPWGQFVFGDYSQGDTWVNGDSGSPAICVINGESVLIGTAYTGNICPAVSQSAAWVNSQIAPEAIQFYDVSQFPDL